MRHRENGWDVVRGRKNGLSPGHTVSERLKPNRETWIPPGTVARSHQNSLGFPGVSLHIYDSQPNEKFQHCDFSIASDAIEFVLCTSGHVLVNASCSCYHPISGELQGGMEESSVHSGVSFSLSRGEGVVSCMQHMCGRALVEKGAPFQAVALRMDKDILPDLEQATQCPFLKKLRSLFLHSNEVLWEKISLPLSLQVTVHQVISKIPRGRLWDIYLACKKMELLYLLLRGFSSSSGEDVFQNHPVTQEEREAAKAVYRRISSDFTAVPSLRELARNAGINKGRLNAVFRIVYGKTVFEIMRDERLEYSKKLLEQGEKNMTEITYLCGFSSPSHFTKSFMKVFGITPKKYQIGYHR
ncbi:helix-turn-helix transcriptional regulator [Pseudodesulfovibrio piezophilus]|uniref:HTH araC/xylS-type domain-containing protein n=1 Tax=Pseudodesulfovibrio piezophilus (strain DSM 21447 / JCM 15486 / C1TLV30) TaxID=1322246 RepID=M1WLU6_PSEP2|nr:AraC family transcriptional regulator [Pseudodesulfovibrio piezophilus]CCH48475.1 protein of unknown function [Pseudodesulfovibrio piezophilus C1TLV30]